MAEVLAVATFMMALVMAAIKFTKSLIPDNKLIPLINVIVALLLCVGWGLSMDKETSIIIYIWAGIISGWAAGGFYDLGVNIKGLVNQSKANKLVSNDEGGQDNNSESDVK